MWQVGRLHAGSASLHIVESSRRVPHLASDVRIARVREVQVANAVLSALLGASSSTALVGSSRRRSAFIRQVVSCKSAESRVAGSSSVRIGQLFFLAKLCPVFAFVGRAGLPGHSWYVCDLERPEV